MATIDDYRWLVSDAAQPWLRRSTERDVDTSLLKELRRHLSKEQAHLIAEQVSLRARGARKFRRADRLYFLPRAVEQATDESIAAYKSASFPPGGRVADLGCGMGGDTMALAASRSLLAVDTDPTCALIAEANLHAVGAGSFIVQEQDAANVALADYAFWHADPDRRATGRRTVRTDQMQPSAAELATWLTVNPNAAIKWAPASHVPPDLTRHAEREWIGHSRTCQQQLVRSGALARYPGRRVATVLLNAEDGTPHTQTLVEAEGESPETVTQLRSYLVEPHAVVIAAGLAPQWASQHGCVQLSSHVAYFTGDQPALDPSAGNFRVVDQLPMRLSPIRDWLRAHHANVVEVKKRGVDADPQAWLRELSNDNEWRLTLILLPFGRRPVALLTERMPSWDRPPAGREAVEGSDPIRGPDIGEG